MRLLLRLTCLLLFCCPCFATQAADNAPPMTRVQVETYLKEQVAKLQPQHGKIALPGDMATLNIPQDFGYLSPKQTEILVHNIWQNPPGSKTLGALIPAGVNLISPESWAVIITYSDDGYVSDKDATTIDYDKLLADMKKGNAEAMQQRKSEGYPTYALTGWATKPHYDKQTHKLYWAVSLLPESSSEESLNYNIRILGRQGYLVLSIVGSMAQLPMIEQNADKILSFVEFNPTHRYADFNPSTDKVAAYGMAALIAGGIAAKAGLFKGLIVALLALKKFLIVGVLAIVAFIKKLFGRDKPKSGQ